MNFSFSVAKRSDTPEILKLYRSLIGMPGCTWHYDYPNREILESDIDAQALYVVLDKSYRIIAAATVRKDFELDDLSWNTKNSCDLARLGVLKDKQNEGIAGFLLQKVLPLVRRKGFDGMRMLVAKNNIIAQKLYERHGFVQLDVVHMYDNDFYRYELIF